MEIPKINNKYTYFDDGKINDSRKDIVEIKEIVSFDDIDIGTLELWKQEVIDCYWLYNEITDFFVKGYLEEFKQEVTFVRCKENGWFSLGWWGGRLDIDGTLNKGLEEYKEKYNLKDD